LLFRHCIYLAGVELGFEGGEDDDDFPDDSDFGSGRCPAFGHDKRVDCILSCVVLLSKIICLLLHEKFGLCSIKEEIKQIEDKLDDEESGLGEIKSEIEDIEKKLDSIVPTAGTLTTGPVVANVNASSLVVKVLNSTASPVTVTVNVYDIGQCPRVLFDSVTFMNIASKCSAHHTFDTPPVQYEVQFVGIQPGVLAWTATRTQGQAAPLSSSNFIEPNTFRHSELVPATDP
jgi:hypothetical protein